jgi:hypothetical protein
MGITFTPLDGGHMKASGPDEASVIGLLAELREYKPELLAALIAARNGVSR